MGKDIFEKRIYTPQFSAQTSAAIRRLAWSMCKPMTKAVEQLILAIPAIKDPSKICLACKDTSDCKSCIFSRHLTAEEKNAILAAL
jgi:recombinational DNA repair protein RecR